MNRLEKQEFVSELAKGVQESQAIALMSFSKLTVEQMTSFRLSLRKKDVMVNEFTGEAKEFKDIDKVEIIFTDTDDKFKKLQFIVGDKI